MNYKIGDLIETEHGKGIVIDVLDDKLSVAIDFKFVEVETSLQVDEKQYKIGDKVETPLGVGVIENIYTLKVREKTYYTYDVVVKGLYIETLKEHHIQPYKTAHEKLLELGYEHHEYSYGDVYELKESYKYKSYKYKSYKYKSYKYNGLSGRIQTDNQGAINCGDVYIGLELSRILTQYLEELEDE